MDFIRLFRNFWEPRIKKTIGSRNKENPPKFKKNQKIYNSSSDGIYNEIIFDKCKNHAKVV